MLSELLSDKKTVATVTLLFTALLTGTNTVKVFDWDCRSCNKETASVLRVVSW